MGVRSTGVSGNEANDLPVAQPEEAKPNREIQVATTGRWLSFAKLVAALGSVGGLLLHLIGYIGHLSYLSAWGLEAGPFRKDLDEILLMGYLAIMDRSNVAISLLSTQIWTVMGAWVALTGYAFLLFRLDSNEKWEMAKRFLQALPPWAPDLLRSILGATLTFALLPAGLLFVLFLTALPVSIGDSFGQSLADTEYKKFVAGCEHVNRGNRCLEIRKDGKRVAHGFVIDSSTSHIALFDVDLQRARTIVREGTELIADSPVAKQLR